LLMRDGEKAAVTDPGMWAQACLVETLVEIGTRPVTLVVDGHKAELTLKDALTRGLLKRCGLFYGLRTLLLFFSIGFIDIWFALLARSALYDLSTSLESLKSLLRLDLFKI
jgi:hypothetical protein